MWPFKNPDFGDLFEEEIERATKIEAQVIFSGTEREAPFHKENTSDRPTFIIERTIGKGLSKRIDRHIFVVNYADSIMGQTEIEWWHQNRFESEISLIRKVYSEKDAHEITRILSKKWDFHKQLTQ